jgi:hypothetical protein
MDPDTHATGDELGPEREEKDAQVLKREGFEEELMDDDESEAGEHTDDVQD